ncbi:ATP-grasp domain-containing protein [Proteiniclasticum sp. BAD-10]|uniref:ATP-grasp domain-containing protein n=1 Tax=Proteiniclasticum sediminis TaxID=2804028 RepID=A0A941HQW5_9CLOT|nr:ATP-grasp domain-containing protein [Proteiniclasticum sediminis]MBR0575577.1 ATP-grasp domain-containing protein [Proteiniclasticum sediminis]
MREINILILSAGRRVELVRSFQNAAKRLSIKSNIVAGDCSETAPAIYFADRKAILPRINEENYIEEIINVCNRENISLVIPTIDTDLLLLSEERERIESESGAVVLIASTEVISICRDKINTQKFLEENGFKIPKMYSEEELDSGKLEFPLFIKPKSGSSSINTFKVNNLEELATYRSLVKEPIVQNFMEGKEFTVDVFLDFDGNLITVVPRLRMATRSGEISKGKIIRDREIIEDIKRLVKVLKPIGHITVQLMKTNKGIEYIEINPRFGGGAPMSIQSGADSCENLYRLLMGQNLEYNENYRDNIMFFRFDNSICVDENLEIVQW